MYGVSDDRCKGFSVACWLFGNSVVDILLLLCVPLF